MITNAIAAITIQLVKLMPWALWSAFVVAVSLTALELVIFDESVVFKRHC